jgi:hypothetical protein
MLGRHNAVDKVVSRVTSTAAARRIRLVVSGRAGYGRQKSIRRASATRGRRPSSLAVARRGFSQTLVRFPGRFNVCSAPERLPSLSR